jgi:hypothetical protein
MANAGTVIGIIIGCFVLYRLRCRKPFWYGVIEVVVAVVTIILTIWPVSVSAATLIIGSRNIFGIAVELPTFLGILGGVYIFVRGMDNMSKELPGWMRKWWHLLF